MKKFNVILIVTFGIMLFSCGQKSSENSNNLSEQNQSQIQNNETTDSTVTENEEAKFLITNNSIGHFQIGGNWQKIAKNDYNYESVQGYGSCTDACCDGGYVLGKVMTKSKDGSIIENPELTIGALSFSDNVSETAHKKNPNVFYISSDNCRAWYWKDKISYIVSYNEVFKTKEGIGVGTTIEKVKEIFGKVVIQIGWLEEDANAVQLKIDSYPSIKFILDVDDAIGGYEKLSTLGETAKISDFKKNTKIKRIIVYSTSN